MSGFYTTGLFSYMDVTSEGFDNGSLTVTDYDADVYTFIGTAGTALGKKTDLTLEYLFSRSDNFKDNAAQGLPLGLENRRHNLNLVCSRKLTDRLKIYLRYGFFEYDEEKNARGNSYTAHLFGVGLDFRL